MRYTLIVLAMVACLVFDATGQPSPRVSVADGVVYVTGLGDLSCFSDRPGVDRAPDKSVINEESLGDVFSVYTHEALVKKLNQPVAGQYSMTPDGCSFKPLYPFSAGASYHVLISSAALSREAIGGHSASDVMDLVFKIPDERVPATLVEGIYPKSEVLPENMLRMYVCFSAPMMPGEAYKHITLLNSKGERIDKAFLVLDQELWDVSRTRFTVLFDPGRIKRGLKANLDLGPPLKDGERYSLRIDSAWRDVHGNSLQRSVVKKFTVAAAVHTSLNVDDMNVIVPPAASRGPIAVRFNRAIDRSLVFKYVSVSDVLGNTIEGQLHLHHDDVITFTPHRPWDPGNYFVEMDPLLEDVSGNNFKNAFDVDLEREGRRSINEMIKLPVSILPAGR